MSTAKIQGPLLLVVLALLGFSLRERSPAQAPSDKARQHANRGVAFLEQFRFAEAVKEFEALVALEPNSSPGHINLGIAYFNQRDFDRALTALKKAKSLDPESPHVHYNLGLIYKLQGRTEEAATAFEKVAELDPDDSMTHYYLGTLYANLGLLDEAGRRLRIAIRLQPDNESAHFSLGNILIRQGKREEGRKELEIFRDLKESFPAEAASAGLQYTELGRYAEAIEEYMPPLQRIPPEEVIDSAVQWRDVSQESGVEMPALAPPPSWPESVAADEYGADFIEERLLPHLGAGLGFRDLDSDGDVDLIFLRGGRPVVLRNEGGRFRQSQSSGLPEEGKFVGLTLGDADNDLDADLYLSGAGPNALFLNDGSGRFTEAVEAGIRGDDISVGSTFADVDHDGDLDIYVANYLDPSASAESSPPVPDVLRVPYDLMGAPNRLYRNNGNGTFTEVGAQSLTDGGASRSLGSVFSDLDDDRDIDFLVVNDGQPAQVFSNDRVGTFTESGLAWGVETSGRRRGVTSADFDRDGSFDLFLTAEGSVLNALLRGPARSRFRPDLLSPGLLSAGVPGSRFGAAFLDADNDTDLDLLVIVNEARVLAAYYENTPSGFRWAGALEAKGSDAGAGRSLAVADVDDDGDLDAAVSTDRGQVLLFRNEGGNARGWVRITARGLRSNKDGLGTKVEVKAGESR
ncbi:MAG: FG-GAP-like repeat-containing protein, partial [Acidobacteriota bacterium]